MPLQISQRSHRARPSTPRYLLLAGLIGLGVAAAPEARAQGFMFHGGGGFGGMRQGGFQSSHMSAQTFRANFHPNNGAFGGHFAGVGGHQPGSMGGHHPGGMGGHHPGGSGPIIGHFPHPGPIFGAGPFHPRRPIVIHHPTLPPVIVERIPSPPVIVTPAPVGVITRAAVSGGSVAPAVAQATPTCATNGTFVSIVFTPNVTAGDITSFLKTYSVTIADGPNNDGVYRLRLSDGALPQNEVLQVVDSMRGQTAVVARIEAQ